MTFAIIAYILFSCVLGGATAYYMIEEREPMKMVLLFTVVMTLFWPILRVVIYILNLRK